LIPHLAKTIVLNLGHNAGKQMFANQKGREFEIIKILCAIKTTITWHNNKLATTCRERCGGGSFLSYNQVSEVVFSSHSGMTAEGDNSVLMQKVVKDIITHVRKGIHYMPDVKDTVMKQIK
jgi:acyl-CoA oxidase